jgi:hypothetical protein
MTRLSCGRYASAPRPPLSPVSKLSLFLSLSVSSPVDLTDGGGGGVELNHAIARKPGPLSVIIQYALDGSLSSVRPSYGFMYPTFFFVVLRFAHF